MVMRNEKVRLVRSQIIEGYSNGSNLRQLAKLYECSPVTIRNVLKASGVVLRSRGRSKKMISATQGVRLDGDNV